MTWHQIHDGTEFLQRVLWDLDISHDYHLVRGGDHGGPTLVPRMRAAYAWLGSVMAAWRSATAEPTADERAVTAWIESGLAGAPPPVRPGSREFIRILRARSYSRFAIAPRLPTPTPTEDTASSPQHSPQ